MSIQAIKNNILRNLSAIVICILISFLFVCGGCADSSVEINYDWHLRFLKVPEIWTKSKGEGINVAVIDSGIDYGLLGENFDRSRIKYTYNAIDESNDLTDNTLHGTGMISLIGANGENGIYGVAPECNFIIIKALNDVGSTTSEILARAINFANDHDADIINLSLGSRNISEEVETAIKTAYAKNTVIISAAGDDGKETVRFPASLKETLSVGALDKEGLRYKDSNYGEGVDLFVPAVEINVPTYDFFKHRTTIKKSGSSVATAVTSGVVALYISVLQSYTVNDLYRIFRTEYANDLTKIIF